MPNTIARKAMTRRVEMVSGTAGRAGGAAPAVIVAVAIAWASLRQAGRLGA
jgi:hypothetical protein